MKTKSSKRFAMQYTHFLKGPKLPNSFILIFISSYPVWFTRLPSHSCSPTKRPFSCWLSHLAGPFSSIKTSPCTLLSNLMSWLNYLNLKYQIHSTPFFLPLFLSFSFFFLSFFFFWHISQFSSLPQCGASLACRGYVIFIICWDV